MPRPAGEEAALVIRTMKPSDYIEFKKCGWEGLIAPEYEQCLKALFSSDVFPSPDFDGNVMAVHSNVGRTYRIFLRPGAPGPDLYAKSFQAKNALHFIENKFVLSSAYRSWKAAHLLSESGALIPRPVAFAQKNKWGFRRNSVFISQAINGAEDENLQSHIVKNFDQKPLPKERAREKRRVIEKLAELYRLVHTQDRVYLPDFHPHNMLWKKEDGDYCLYLMDFDEVKFRARKNDRLKNLASMCRNADKIVKKMDNNIITTTDRIRFLSHYLGPDQNQGDLQELWKKVVENWYLK